MKGGYWLNARDVDLTSEWDLKWLYIDTLKEERVKMEAEEDKLAWPEKKKIGIITAKLAYDLIAKRWIKEDNKWWFKKQWD